MLAIVFINFFFSLKRVQRERNEDAVGESIIKSSTEKYKMCEKFKFKCVACKAENLMASALKRHQTQMIPVLDKCSNDECTVPPHQYIDSIKNQIIMEMRKFIRRFYENWLVCDEATCNYNTRNYTHVSLLYVKLYYAILLTSVLVFKVTMSGQPICFVCKQGSLSRYYSETELNNQLSYFSFLFDLSQYPHARKFYHNSKIKK